MTKTVVVTGSSGYIGGETVLILKDLGYRVLGIDQVEPSETLAQALDEYVVDNFASDAALAFVKSSNTTAIVHCAGTSLVGPSVRDPAKYYENNFVNTKRLLDFLRDNNLFSDIRVIFSSSAAVYGEPIFVPCSEEDPPLPVSPYGESKLMVEMMLQSYRKAYNLDFVVFRYFNVCGADSQGRHGQASRASHIVAKIMESLIDKKTFQLNGNDYPTPDGTCIRDYLHVEDIAQAHELALDRKVSSGIYNLGNQVGSSNLEIISAVEKELGISINYVVGPRRDGDPAQLSAKPDRIRALGWKPKYNINNMIQHAWKWYTRNDATSTEKS